MVEDEVGTIKVDGIGVNNNDGEVGVWSTAEVLMGLPESGVDADSVASRFEVWVGAEEGALQARIKIKAIIKIKKRLFIFFLKGFKMKLFTRQYFRPNASAIWAGCFFF